MQALVFGENVFIGEFGEVYFRCNFGNHDSVEDAGILRNKLILTILT